MDISYNLPVEEETHDNKTERTSTQVKIVDADFDQLKRVITTLQTEFDTLNVSIRGK